MKIERTKNATRNIVAGMALKIYQMVVPFLMRTAMIHLMGVEYLGLNSLFNSILHILNLAELGVGVAMVFSMYKPIAEDDTPRICALMALYRRYYRLIGLAIGAAGLVILPFVPRLIADGVPAELNVYWLYLLNLGTTVLSYWLFAYRNCLLQAHQRLDIASKITIFVTTIQFGLQLLVIVYLKNYYYYTIISMASTAVNNVLTAIITKKKYPHYRPEGTLAKEEIRTINGKIRDIFAGKIGLVVQQYADTVVISAFLGLTALAVYQNYFFVLTSVIAIVEIVLSSITAGLGNSFVTEGKEKNYRDMLKFTFLFLWAAGVCTCCFLGMYQPFMQLWVGEELMLGFGMVICYSAYFVVYELNRLSSIYKDAAGLWHQDRAPILVAVVVNLTLNLLTVRTLGLYGVLLSTIVAVGGVEIPWRLHNLFTLTFSGKNKVYYRLLATMVTLTVLAGALVCLLCGAISLSPWLQLLVCAVVSVIIPNVLFLLVLRKHEQFRPAVQFVDRLTKGKLKLERRLSRGM